VIPFATFVTRARRLFVPLFGCAFWAAPVLLAQATPQGPMGAPEDHHVTRIGTESVPEAPPALSPAEIIKNFSRKEDEYLAARPRYSFRKSVHIQEFGPDGNPSGELLRVAEYTPRGDGKVSVRLVEKPQSTLQSVFLAPEDLEALDRVPAFPFITEQLPKYDFKYLGKEQVDEIDCYIFQAKPKTLERKQAYFDGIVWVDATYLDAVKTYGKWVTDQGARPVMMQLPFSLFETYRENVGGKFWFPSYSRSDDVLHVKDTEVPMRIVIKWSDFKPVPTGSAASASPLPNGPITPGALKPEAPKP
jgi:hypothetical protein